MPIHNWTYPLIAQRYNALADYAASEHNLPYFLQRAADYPSQHNIQLAQHNIELYKQHQADAISFCSRD